MVLGSIILIITRVYFEPVLLCDDNGLMLYELKTEFYSEVTKYNTSIVEIDEYINKMRELQKMSAPNFRNFSLEENYINNHRIAIMKYNEAFFKITQLEVAIKKFEPGFKPSRYLIK
jgi:hypothetical protein